MTAPTKLPLPNLEVELKFALQELDRFMARVQELGGSFTESVRQQDTYFRHPCRDFARTDEALRIRVDREQTSLTYKGPKLDPRCKTRVEIDLPLGPNILTADTLAAILDRLGFQVAATVVKDRRSGKLVWMGRTVTVTCDVVDRLGSFVELEVLCSPAERTEAQDQLWQLAHVLGLADLPAERRSYLELLLAKIQGAST